MVYLYKRDCLYVLMCSAWTLVWTREQICLQIYLWLLRGGPLHLHHPSKSHQMFYSWDFSHLWDFSRHYFYTVTSLIVYPCTPCYQLTPLQSCSSWLDDANVTIRIALYLHSALLSRITLLLVSRGNVAVTYALCNSILLVFRGDGADIPLCILHNYCCRSVILH